MPIDAPAPPEQQQSPFWQGPDALVMEEFNGVDTNTSRYGVSVDKCFWIDGWFPLAPKKLRTLPDVGTALYTSPTGKSIPLFDFANISTSPICVIFLSDGSIQQVTTDTKVQTQIAPANTITNPSQVSVGIAQWGSQYLIIVANQPNGYWLWDGNFLYTAGTVAPGPVVTNNGSGYAKAPTITPYGGSGSGASFAAIFNGGMVTGVSIENPGSGYLATDAVGLQFSDGGNTSKTAIITPTINTGTIASLTITDGGFGYSKPSAITLTVIGGGGTSGAAAVTTVTSSSIAAVSITNAGQGYVTAPTILVNDPNNTVAQATVSMMPFGIQGNAVETYQGRVWVVNGAEYTWSAPGSVTDFATSDGGGNATSVDSFLRVGYTAIKQSSGILYLIGDSSINYISGVTTSGTPPTTTFTNQNANPEVGTPYPSTVDLWNNSIVFANSYGAHLNVGSSPQKISEDLDGVYTSVPNFFGLSLSSGKATIFGKKVWMMLVPIIDPVTNAQVNKLLMWDGKRWWASTQSVALSFIQHQEINSTLTAWGTNGTSIYPLFQKASSAFTKTVQSKLWGAPGGYQFTKSVGRFWSLIDFSKSSTINVTVNIDSELNESPYTLASATQTILVKNASGTTIPCKNATPITIPVVSIFSGHFVTPPFAVGQQGALTGMTISTTEPDITLISAMISDQIAGYRG